MPGDTMTAALEGIKVLDLSRYIAGPYCGQLLGDLGADVLKVERIEGGEEGRRVGELINGESLFFMSSNRNKRSLTLDFRNERSQQVLRDLCAEADIVIENFRPGTMEKMGCGWDVLSEINPGLVMVRVSGFGQDGPLAQHPCFDGAAQALSGVMTMTGQPGGAPTMAGLFICDYSTAIYAAFGAVAALRARALTGRGQVVEATLMESAMSMLTTAIPEKMLLDYDSNRLGNRDRYLSPSHCFQSEDGVWIYVVAGNDHHFQKFAAAMDMPELCDDPRFSNFMARNDNVELLESIIDEWAAALPGEVILGAIHEAGVPCEKLSTIGDLIHHPQVVHRKQIVDVPHPEGGTVPFQAPPIRLSDTPAAVWRGPPSLGQHTEEALREWLGLDAGEIEALRSDNVV